MREQKVIGVLLLFSAFILLNTCQLQFNKSTGNNVALRVVVPGGASGGGKSAPALGSGAKSLANGTSVTVTITQEGTTFSTQQTVSIDGKTSIDFSFSLSSSGTYDVSALMQDASGNTLAQATTKLTMPAGNYPVVLTMYSNLLLDAVITDNLNEFSYPFYPPFNPTISSGYTANLNNNSLAPYTLTLTTVDPNATITSVAEVIGGIDYVDSHTGSAYTLSYNGFANSALTIVVTAEDGTTTTYMMTLYYPS